ncbi:hypothetical protein CK203_046447 [Vitis vinifera]|uniref:Reverse transcriptase zinc-binding domain-containing protein n=1 Tax=Vitis vinifera TaxID=29760 RepID=A0A438I1Y3_VITVI|nr:hypothetical protein CK203_046447 [Vitis vinifera]
MNFKVGKGTKIRFWKDPWCGEVELARRFPQLFNMAAQRSATVGELWDHNSDLGSWNLRFLRGFNDWELNMVVELLQILRSQRITMEEDLALWKGGKNGKFEVKEAYELLISHSTLLFPKKGIWVENVPSKLAFFAWEATWGGFSRLIGYKREGVARVLWGIVLGLVGAQWVFPESVKEVIVSWKGDMVLFVEEQSLRKQALEEYKKWVIMEETYWRGNSMVKIKINGTWVTEKCDIKEWSGSGLPLFLSETEEWRPKCNELQVGVLGRGRCCNVEDLFSKEEVFGTLLDLNGDKVPGPDGFSMAFWQFSWSFLKEEVMGSLRIFMISFFKLLAKVLANRLKKKGEGGGRICKLDIEKTYDHFSRLEIGGSLIPLPFSDCHGAPSCLLKRAREGGFLSGWRFRGRGGVSGDLSLVVRR